MAILRKISTVLAVAAVLCSLNVVCTASPAAAAVDNGLARTPPMGWNGYNHFSRDVTASIVKTEARTIVSSGMKAAGYQYVNLDGGWDLLQRGVDGQLQPDPSKFPDGIKPVADYVHSLGLKFGIYTTVGTTNCAGTSAGSMGHYQQDVDTFASWGVDYVKVDWCAVPMSQFPGMSSEQVAQQLYSEFGQALRSAGRPMVYSLSTNTPNLQAWTWAPSVGNLWRTSHDVADNYTGMLANFTENAQHAAAAGPGGWNDPDMLEIGNGGMTPAEDRSQFSLWAEMAAPLIAGNDLTTMSAATRQLLTNRDVIAVDQDPLGEQGTPVASADGHWVFTKPLANGDRALVLFNQTDQPALITTSAAAIGLARQHAYLLHDLWQHGTRETSGTISAAVPPHAVVMYRVTSTRMPAAAAPSTVTSLAAADPSLSPDQPSTITQTFTDNGSVPVHDVVLTLTAPSGWSITPRRPAVVPVVEAGHSIQQIWRVTAPPPDLPLEAATLRAAARYAWRGPSPTSAVSSALDLQVLDPAATPIPRSQMTATATSSQRGNDPSKAIDGDTGTFWHTEFSPAKAVAPQSITLDLGGSYDADALLYQPRQDGILNGTIFSYKVYASTDGTTFEQVASGTWLDTPAPKSVTFTTHGARYIRLEGVQGVNTNISAAEIDIGGAAAA